MTASARLPVRADGGLRLAVVADTHSQPHAETNRHLSALAPDAIIHAGDIGDREVLEALKAIAPVFAVRGNIDPPSDLPDLLFLDVPGATNNDAPRMRILLTHIAVYGPKLRADVAAKARAEGASLVLCGHSHVPFIGRDRGITVFNPGSIGPRRFHLPIVFGTFELSNTGVRLAHIDCETGLPWSPPG